MSENPLSALSAEGFSTFYEDTIEPALSKFEQDRQRDIRLVYASIAVTAIGGAIVFLLDTDSGLLSFFGMALIVAGLAGQHVVRKRMRTALKNALVAPVCKFFGLTYTHKPARMPIKRFVRAGLLPAQYDKFSTEDQISGTHKGVAVDLGELTLTRTVRDTDDDKSSEETVFQGMILTYSFAKPFIGETRILSNASGLLGWLSRSGLKPQQAGERVHLEDPVFEEQFNVYSTDQVEARYLLTPRFMERLVALSVHFSERNGVSVAFSENDILICLRSGKDRFEGGGLFKQLNSRERVEELLGELDQVLGIVDVLDLTNQTHI